MHFDFVFLIQLRYVSEESSLVEIVKNQHDMLQEVPNELVEKILYGYTKHKVLILLDGYDEYKAGSNMDIDITVMESMRKCFFILTSRPGYISQDLRDRMDAVLFITGLSTEGVHKLIKLLPERNKSGSLSKYVSQADITDILSNPILLIMASHVCDAKSTFPETKTQLIGALFELSMDRTSLKTFGVKASKIENIQEILNVLGELSWKALQTKHHQLLISKVN